MTDTMLMVLYGVLAVFVVALIFVALRVFSVLGSVKKTIDDVGPVIEKANQTIDSLQPAIQRVDPLLERVSLTVDAVNLEIMRADQILADVTDVTGSLSTTVEKVSNVTDAPLNLLNSATEKLRTFMGDKQAGSKSADATEAAAKSASEVAANDVAVAKNTEAAAEAIAAAEVILAAQDEEQSIYVYIAEDSKTAEDTDAVAKADSEIATDAIADAPLDTAAETAAEATEVTEVTEATKTAPKADSEIVTDTIADAPLDTYAENAVKFAGFIDDFDPDDDTDVIAKSEQAAQDTSNTYSLDLSPKPDEAGADVQSA